MSPWRPPHRCCGCLDVHRCQGQEPDVPIKTCGRTSLSTSRSFAMRPSHTRPEKGQASPVRLRSPKNARQRNLPETVLHGQLQETTTNPLPPKAAPPDSSSFRNGRKLGMPETSGTSLHDPIPLTWISNSQPSRMRLKSA